MTIVVMDVKVVILSMFIIPLNNLLNLNKQMTKKFIRLKQEVKM